VNPLTLVGIIGGFAIIIGSIALTARDVLVFVNLPGALIVLGGTIAATIVSYPPRYLLRVGSNLISALRNENLYNEHDIDEIVSVAREWHKSDLKAVEDHLPRLRSPFLKTGVQLVIDGTHIDDINELLEWRIARLRAKERAEAAVFRTMGNYAPAFGMLGTLLGLVNMLYDMSGGAFDQIGLSMAVALITTFYGLILSNLVFKPIATKLEDRTEQRVRTLSMALEAINLIQQKRSPTFIRETLKSFMADFDDEVVDENGRHKAESVAQ